jgi:flagellin
MTRINTNIISLTAQQNLAMSNNQLQTTLTRLSTGLQINSGADNPSGLIATTDLGNDIANSQQAISNSQVANQMISTADSALSQISTLLTSMQGLVNQAANTATMSPSEIAANQLQIDSSLDAINRISQTTSFQGRNLLDGSLGFHVAQGTGYGAVQSLQINQANFGTASSVPVNINVTALATQAKIGATVNDGVSTDVAASTAAPITFADGSTLTVTAPSTGTTANDIGVTFAESANQAVGTASAAFDSTTNTLTITVNNTGTTTANTIAAAINNDTNFAAVAGGTTPTTNGFNVTNDSAAISSVAYTNVAADGTLTVNALRPGANFITGLTIAGSANLTSSNPQVSYDATTGAVTVTIDNNAASTTSLSAIATALDNYKDSNGNSLFSAVTGGSNPAATLAGSGLGTDVGGTGTVTAGGDAGAILSAGTGVSGLQANLTLDIGGNTGSQLVTFDAGTTAAQIASAINQISDATGVTAKAEADHLEFSSSDYGSAANVTVKVVNEGTGGAFGSSLTANNASGTDIGATVNNVAATGAGNTVSFNSPNLSFSAALNPTGLTVSENINFSITGGGALFQLGPTVESGQQARLGIQSTDTGSLGGTMGQLYELASGNSAALNVNASLAGQIATAASNQVSELRGRLGAFQAETVDTNINALTDAVTNLTAAQSTIKDTDFAAASANLTREQILVQAGTSVLTIANKNPQSVLTLLQNA